MSKGYLAVSAFSCVTFLACLPLWSFSQCETNTFDISGSVKSIDLKKSTISLVVKKGQAYSGSGHEIRVKRGSTIEISYKGKHNGKGSFRRLEDIPVGLAVVCQGQYGKGSKYSLVGGTNNDTIRPDFNNRHIVGVIQSVTETQVVLTIEKIEPTGPHLSKELVAVTNPSSKTLLLATFPRSESYTSIKNSDLHIGDRLWCTGWDLGADKPMYADEIRKSAWR